MSEKGKPCHMLWGKHHGKKAWLNAEKKETKRKYHVVILEPNGKEKETTVYKYIVRPGHCGSPQSKLEGASQQLPELEVSLNKAFKCLAKCNIKDWSDELTDFVRERFDAALDDQRAQGSKATWYRVEYKKKKRKTRDGSQSDGGSSSMSGISNS